jgi:HAD superfamily hydrolase (TIGR01484 family)
LGGAAAAAAFAIARRCACSSAIGRSSNGTDGQAAAGKFELSSVALVALDLDGTLCRRDGTVSARNRDALATLRRQGVTVVLATGRPASSAKSLPALVGGEVDYVVVSNGGETYSAQGGGWTNVSSLTMASADVVSIVARLEERVPTLHAGITFTKGINCHAFRSWSEFTQKRVPPSARKRYSSIDIANPPPDMCLVDSVALFDAQPSIQTSGAQPLSILLFSEECQDPFELQRLVLEHIGDLVAASDPPVRCELAGLPGMVSVMSQAAGDKSVALEALRCKLGLGAHQTVAFGDGLNDCAMLKWAGCGWSMARVEDPAVTSAGDREAPDHEEDGVGQVLETVIEAKVANQHDPKGPR